MATMRVPKMSGGKIATESVMNVADVMGKKCGQMSVAVGTFLHDPPGYFPKIAVVNASPG